MSQVVNATFEDGVLKPHERLNLAPGTQVRIVISPCNGANLSRQPAFAELERFRKQHPIHSRGNRLTRDQLHERC
jgi:predicted DNA-binding antitoxin AbrB/MazE fold protein